MKNTQADDSPTEQCLGWRERLGKRTFFFPKVFLATGNFWPVAQKCEIEPLYPSLLPWALLLCPGAGRWGMLCELCGCRFRNAPGI